MNTSNPRVWFKSISLENVRSFGTKQTINFTDKDGNDVRWNVILGDNGTGKTTVLKCIYISVQDYYAIFEYGLSYSGLLRSDRERGMVQGIVSDLHKTYEVGFGLAIKPQKIRSSISEFWYVDDYQLGLPVNAYGASRRIGESAITQTNSDSALNLFDENADLINAEEWLVQADYLSLKDESFKGRFELVKKLLLNLFIGEISDLDPQIMNLFKL